jgi:DNA-binding CsgD family transcriptional regulator
MEWEAATKRQLLQIALREDCSIADKYAACREMHVRQWRDTMLEELVLLYGRGISPFLISIELGVDEYTVRNKIKQYGLKRRQGA